MSFVKASLAVLALAASPLAQGLSESDFACFNESLPNVTIYATGGTIAGSASSDTQTTGYTAGALGVLTLIEAVPSLCSISNVRGVQIVNTGSPNITPKNLLNISQQIQADFDTGLTAGALVTHGTDTLEETAFFLDLTVNSDNPVIVLGAMRPATAISADGPMNLLAAVTLAVSPQAKGRGAMVVLNDRIGSARYTTKTNANTLNTFVATEQGFLGVFENVKPVFYYPAARPLGHTFFNVSTVAVEDGLPQVDILYGYQALEPELVNATVNQYGALGVVLAGSGAGSWSSAGRQAVNAVVAEKATPVVFSTRTGAGFVESMKEDGEYLFGAGFLNPQKCRILLQLCVQMGYSTDEIRAVFEYHDFE